MVEKKVSEKKGNFVDIKTTEKDLADGQEANVQADRDMIGNLRTLKMFFTDCSGKALLGFESVDNFPKKEKMYTIIKACQKKENEGKGFVFYRIEHNEVKQNASTSSIYCTTG